MHKYKKNEQKFIFRLVFSVFGLRRVAVASRWDCPWAMSVPSKVQPCHSTLGRSPHIRKRVSIFLPKTCLLFALYMPPTHIGTSLEPDWNLIGTSLEPRRIITDTSSHNHREIIRIKITNQNLFPFGIFGKPTTRARVVLKLLSPNMVQDILARAYLVSVLRQVFEQSKLDIGNPYNLRTTHHTMRKTVYDYVSKTIFHQR